MDLSDSAYVREVATFFRMYAVEARAPDRRLTADRLDAISERLDDIPTRDELRELSEKAGKWDEHFQKCCAVGLTVCDADNILFN